MEEQGPQLLNHGAATTKALVAVRRQDVNVCGDAFMSHGSLLCAWTGRRGQLEMAALTKIRHEPGRCLLMPLSLS